MEHFAFPGNIDFAPMTKAHFDVFTIGESRTISHANDTQTQQMTPNPRPGRFSIETPLERERRLPIKREQLEEKTSTRNRGAEGTSFSTAKATPTTRDRGTGDWNQRHYDRSLSKTHPRRCM